MNNNNPTLKDTSLFMMVRDEIINPAGGIYPILTRHAPMCEVVDIFDTGSRDGTRELLEQLVTEIPNLRVHDLKFEGFGSTRTKATKAISARYILVVDADNLIFENSLAELAKFRDANPKLAGIDLPIYNVSPYHVQKGLYELNPRFYLREKAKRYRAEVWEFLEIRGRAEEASSARMYHFEPTTPKGVRNKNKFYENDLYHYFKKGIAPSEHPNYSSWKQPDPKTLAKFGIDLEEVARELKKRGFELPST